MKDNRRVTVMHIAEALNISIGTVDRALHGRPGIKEATRVKVLEKAAELNYQVNMVAQSLSRKKNIKIGAIIPNRSTNIKYFYDDVTNGIYAASEDLRDNKVEIITRNVDTFDYNSQISAFESLQQEEVDGLVICPFHRFELNRFIDSAVDNGIPVVTIGNDAPESKRLMHISAGAYKIGEMAGELMAKLLGFNGSVVVLTGFNAFSDNVEKVSGFSSKLGAIAPGIKIREVYETYELNDKAYSFTIKALESFADLSGIYVNTVNSPGVCEALAEKGKAGAVRLITSDIFNENIPYIENGTIYATIYQNPFRQGHKAIFALYHYIASNRRYTDPEYVKPELVMCSNLSFYTQSERKEGASKDAGVRPA
jgi:LacI family transcriptional regulator